MNFRSRLPYFRDVWGLGPASTRYPGSFPNGLVNRIKEKGWWGDKRLWLFSGSFMDRHGITVDLKRECRPDIVADCSRLPIVDEAFDFVNLDPPYSAEEAERLYGTRMPNLLRSMNEAARVCRPGGLVVLLHRVIPWHHPEENKHKKRLRIVAIVGVFVIGGYTNLRALSIWRKEGSLMPHVKLIVE